MTIIMSPPPKPGVYHHTGRSIIFAHIDISEGVFLQRIERPDLESDNVQAELDVERSISGQVF